MNTPVYQMQRLEKYVLSNQTSIDKVFATTISKLYNREITRILKLIERLQSQLSKI